METNKMRINLFFGLLILFLFSSCEYEDNVRIIGTGRTFYYSSDKKDLDGKVCYVIKYNQAKLPLVEVEISHTSRISSQTTLYFYDANSRLIRKEHFYEKDTKNKSVSYYDEHENSIKETRPRDSRGIARTYLSDIKYDSNGVIQSIETQGYAQYRNEKPYLETTSVRSYANDNDHSECIMSYSQDYINNSAKSNSGSQTITYDDRKNMIRSVRTLSKPYFEVRIYRYDDSNRKIYEARKTVKTLDFDLNNFISEEHYSYNDSGLISEYKVISNGNPVYDIKYDYEWIKK